MLAEWDTFEILIWNFDFNKKGTLIKRKPQSWLKQVPAGQTIEQQPHSREEPAVLKLKSAPFSRSGEQQNQRGFQDGQSVVVPDTGALGKKRREMINNGIRRSKSLGLSFKVNIDS